MQDYTENNNINNNSENNEIPRWNPSPDDYNTPPKPPKDEKPKKKWLIPLILVVAVMVAAIIVGVIIGMNNTKKTVKEEAQKQAEIEKEISAKEIAKSETPNLNNSSKQSGYVLTDVSSVVENVIPSVVSITSRTLVDQYQDFYSFFFGGYRNNRRSDDSEKQEVESGIGSGTIIQANDKELLILTSYHVVEGCSSLYVTFTDDESVEGSVKAASQDTDIAIVSVPMEDIPQATLDSIKVATLSTDSVKVGEGVIVIGNALGYGISVTTGIVSATERVITVDGKSIIVTQTDAAINAGNSGGCMINAKGEIVGISEAKIIIDNVEGMCYAIPIDINSGLIQELLEAESEEGPAMKDKEGAYLGIQGRDVTSSNAQKYDMPEGVYIAGVIKGYGAEAAGLQEGDIITAVDKVSTKTMSALQLQLSKYNPGDVVTLTFMREGEEGYEKMTAEVTLSAMIS